MPAPKTSVAGSFPLFPDTKRPFSLRRGQSNHSTRAQVVEAFLVDDNDDDKLISKARSMPLLPADEGKMQDFFFRSHSRSPLLCRNGSGLSVKSCNSTRTVGSLREAPACPVDALSEDEDGQHFLPIRQSIHFVQAHHHSPLHDNDDHNVPPVVVAGGGGGDSPRSVLLQVQRIEQKNLRQPPPPPPPPPPPRVANCKKNGGIAETSEPDDHHDDDNHPLDVSCVSSVTLSQPFTTTTPDAEKSDVSLTATDVKFLVKALQRASGDDFSVLIDCIKKKQELPLLQFKQQSKMKKRQQQPSTLHTNNNNNNSNDDGGSEMEAAANAPATYSRNMFNDQDNDLAHTMIPFDERNNSILEEERGDDDSSAGSNPIGEEDEIAIGRKISFSPEDRVRLYDLTEDEILHKCKRVVDDTSLSVDDCSEETEETGDDDILQYVREQWQGRHGDMPPMFCASGTQVDDAAGLFNKLLAGSVETAKGLRKKYEEKGWLKDTDGLMGYFDRASKPGDPSKSPCFCMLGREREPSEAEEFKIDVASFAQIIKTTESQEGMSSPDVPTTTTTTTTVPRQRSSLRSGVDDSKGSLPVFAARRKAQQKMEQRTWTTIGSNPFRDTTPSNNENEGSKIGSMSFGTVPIRTSTANSIVRPKEDGSSKEGDNVTVTYSYIHLLETDTDPGCDDESENHHGSRFEF